METLLMDSLRTYAREEKIPFSCSIELTQRCNFSCKHCYCSCRQEDPLSFQEITTMVDQLVLEGCLTFSLTGGEVLLRDDFLDIYTYIKNKGALVSILTNGSLLTQKIIDVFKELPPLVVYITLYGSTKEEYEHFTGAKKHFELVMNGIEMLKNEQIPFILRTIAMEHTYEGLVSERFQQLAQHCGADFNYDVLVFPKMDGTKDNLYQRLSVEKIIDLENRDSVRKQEWEKAITNMSQPKEFQCAGGQYNLFIDQFGNGSICSLYRKPSVSLLENTVHEAWAKIKREREHMGQIYNNSECGACEKKTICRWCPGYSMLEHSQPDKRIPYFCHLADARMDAYQK